MKLENGVKVSDITNKELLNYGVKKGFVIISINGEKVYTVDDVQDKIEAKSTNEVIRIVMMNLNGEVERYIFR